MTEEEVIDGLLQREGGDTFTDDPVDKGGPTKFGITAATLGNWRALQRTASRAEVQALTETEARAIYRTLYIEQPGFTRQNIPFEALRIAIIDEGVNAGTVVAVRHLQEALGVEVDGIFGPVTKAAVKAHPYLGKVLVKVVHLRCVRYARIVQRNPEQRRFLAGWINRSFELLEAA
jgi:lysozyme family protein